MVRKSFLGVPFIPLIPFLFVSERVLLIPLIIWPDRDILHKTMPMVLQIPNFIAEFKGNWNETAKLQVSEGTKGSDFQYESLYHSLYFIPKLQQQS